jgi:hypothetical protein
MFRAYSFIRAVLIKHRKFLYLVWNTFYDKNIIEKAYVNFVPLLLPLDLSYKKVICSFKIMMPILLND